MLPFTPKMSVLYSTVWPHKEHTGGCSVCSFVWNANTYFISGISSWPKRILSMDFAFAPK